MKEWMWSIIPIIISIISLVISIKYGNPGYKISKAKYKKDYLINQIKSSVLSFYSEFRFYNKFLIDTTAAIPDFNINENQFKLFLTKDILHFYEFIKKDFDFKTLVEYIESNELTIDILKKINKRIKIVCKYIKKAINFINKLEIYSVDEEDDLVTYTYPSKIEKITLSFDTKVSKNRYLEWTSLINYKNILNKNFKLMKKKIKKYFSLNIQFGKDNDSKYINIYVHKNKMGLYKIYKIIHNFSCNENDIHMKLQKILKLKKIKGVYKKVTNE